MNLSIEMLVASVRAGLIRWTTVHPFAYQIASSVPDAVDRLARPGSAALGGGTDLLVLIKEGLEAPDLLVDLRRIPGGHEITTMDDGGLRIGGSVRVAQLAAHPRVVRAWPVLAQACESVGTPALRNMGTIAGNLCQRPRCWYFRRNVPCHKNGGDTCPARDGENQYHAIFGGGPCYIVHPSDPAVALAALEARVEIQGPAGARTVSVEDLFVLPRDRLDRETTLARGEVISAIVLPAGSAGGWQRYAKLMQRDAWDFALVSLAAVKRTDGEVRLVLGGVAPRPWRVYGSVEEDAAVGGLDESDVATLADRALYDAEPLALNGYKVALAATLLRRAIREIGTS